MVSKLTQLEQAIKWNHIPLICLGNSGTRRLASPECCHAEMLAERIPACLWRAPARSPGSVLNIKSVNKRLGGGTMHSSPSVTEQNPGAEPGAVLRLLALSPWWVPAGSHSPSTKRGCACELSLPPSGPRQDGRGGWSAAGFNYHLHFHGRVKMSLIYHRG